LARKTPLRKPNRGEGIVSRKPRPKSAHDFLGLLYCFIVLLCICVVSCPYVISYPTIMARYSLFVMKVPLNPNQPLNSSIPYLLLLFLLLFFCPAAQAVGVKTKQNVKQRLQRLLIRCSLCRGSYVVLFIIIIMIICDVFLYTVLEQVPYVPGIGTISCPR